MSTQHTPGPWFADKLQDRDTFNIFASSFMSAMCQVSCMENSQRRVSGEEVAANARLIAAAPELLAALDAMTYYFSEYEKDDSAKYVFRAARAAIAKATGK